MKIRNVLALLFFVCLASFSLAAEGDTTKVESHQETHWDWNGSWYDTTAFPQSGEYRKILMYYTLGCPSIGCSGWDYTTKIEVEDQVNDSTTRWVELTRIITPYAGDKNEDWKHTWIIDVTDYAPVLTGERRVRAFYGGWQDGFTVTINFDFIEGTPPREVLALNTIYDGTFKYGLANNPIEDHLVPTDVDIHPDLASAKFRMVASGHSFGGNENCAEFCRKWFRLNINGTQSHQQYVWRDNCGSNPSQAQTGTWIYNRAGWCPGDFTTPYDEEVGAFLTPGGTASFDVNWQSYNYNGGASVDPQYIIESTLFQYDDWNFATDVELVDVLRPSTNDRVWDQNPICNNPRIMVRNTGSELVTEMRISYWVEGSPDQFRYKWKGVLLSNDTTMIDLPSVGGCLFGGKTRNIFHAEIVEVNGEADEYEGNNHFKSEFVDTELFPEEFVIVFDNNLANNETTYRVENDMGDVVFERTSSASNGLFYDTLMLDTGCYTMYVNDSDCDGLSFPFNNDGNGRLWLHPNDEDDFFPAFYMFEPEFGCEHQISFTVGHDLGDPEECVYPTGREELATGYELKAYPNPAKDRITLAIEGDKEMGGKLKVFNTTGQQVYETIITGRNGVVVENLPSGQYFAQYKTEQSLKTVKFVIIN